VSATVSVSSLLEQRLSQTPVGTLRRPLVFAATLHLTIGLGAWLIPMLLAPKRQPIDYVAVQIVPAVRLGVEQPKPAPPAPKPKEPQKVVEPKKESKAPVLPDAKLKKKPAEKAPTQQPAKVATDAPSAPPEVEGSKTGVASGLAVGAPSATFDNPDFTYGYYVDQMLAIISRNWSRPPVGSGVETVVHYRIGRDGTLSEIRIVRSSGINSFDLAALRAVQSSSPLPPLPRAFRESSLGVNLIVR
jgi:TonB family protein